MKLITKRNCFNDEYMLSKGSEVEIVREYLFEGHPAIVFKDVESGEEFRCMKNENTNLEHAMLFNMEKNELELVNKNFKEHVVVIEGGKK